MPGYQSSKLCFDHFLTNSCLQLRRDRLEIVYKYYAVEYSDCAACPKGTFVRTYLANQTCLRCSYCMPGDIVESRCTSKSDTLCIPQRNVIGTTNTTYVKGLNIFYKLHIQRTIFQVKYLFCNFFFNTADTL